MVYFIFHVGFFPLWFTAINLIDMITVNINDQLYSFTPSVTITHILEQLNIASLGIAVAVNNEVATRTSWATRKLSEGDKVLVIQATQGG